MCGWSSGFRTTRRRLSLTPVSILSRSSACTARTPTFEMTKLLWHSNAPWANTGYGMQTALFAPGLAKQYDMAISAFFGLEGAPIKWEGIPVFPGMSTDVRGQYLAQHANRFFGGDPKGGLVVTLMDVWVMDPRFASQGKIAS